MRTPPLAFHMQVTRLLADHASSVAEAITYVKLSAVEPLFTSIMSRHVVTYDFLLSSIWAFQ